MVGESAETKEALLALIDTNVIIEGAIHLKNAVESPEAKVWSAFLEGKLKMALSRTLLYEVTRVAKRLAGKDFASKLRSQILDRASIVQDVEFREQALQLRGQVPDEDLMHAALAIATKVRYVISNNREFLRSLRGEFECLTPKSFVQAVRL